MSIRQEGEDAGTGSNLEDGSSHPELVRSCHLLCGPLCGDLDPGGREETCQELWGGGHYPGGS